MVLNCANLEDGIGSNDLRYLNIRFFAEDVVYDFDGVIILGTGFCHAGERVIWLLFL
jgi:hypothetical protein